MLESSDERLRIAYVLTCAGGEDPLQKAREIAREQTVELPRDCVPAEIEERIVGRVEEIEQQAESHWRAVLSYDVVTIGDDIPQLLNLLFGNISLKAGILLTEIGWPQSQLARWPGPRFGIDGLREICRCGARRPLLCAALKPLGLPAHDLARICYRLVVGGIDIIKDDHSLASQETSPFRERVERCQAAVAQASMKTGWNSVYFPNVTGPISELVERSQLARAVGCPGVLLSPLLVGLDAARWVAESSGLAILGHPSLAGALFQSNHGIAPEVLLGQIFRVVGCDGVIYPNVGGRFPFSEADCAAINANLRAPLGALRPSFPVPGGGIDVARLPYWIARYGVDTMFLIGGGLYAQPNLEEVARRLRHAVEQV